MLRFIISCLSLFLFSPASHAGCVAASDYNDCIIDAMKGVTSNLAALAIKNACHAKFAVKIVVSPVPQQVIADLTSGLGNGSELGQLSGTVYNGNKVWAITSITVLITPKSGKPAEGKAYNAKILDANYLDDGRGAMPQTNGLFRLPSDMDLSSGYDWKIVGAKGYRSR